MNMLFSLLSRYLSLRIWSRKGITFGSLGPYREKMFKLLSWILNVDLVQWPGMILVCETRWLEREGDIRGYKSLFGGVLVWVGCDIV